MTTDTERERGLVCPAVNTSNTEFDISVEYKGVQHAKTQKCDSNRSQTSALLAWTVWVTTHAYTYLPKFGCFKSFS